MNESDEWKFSAAREFFSLPISNERHARRYLKVLAEVTKNSSYNIKSKGWNSPKNLDTILSTSGVS